MSTWQRSSGITSRANHALALMRFEERDELPTLESAGSTRARVSGTLLGNAFHQQAQLDPGKVVRAVGPGSHEAGFEIQRSETKKGNMPAKKTIFQKIGDDAVRAKTNKVWRDWFRILDKFGLKEKGHTPAAKFLRDKHGLSDWWAQAVTIRYEWERGLRGKESAR